MLVINRNNLEASRERSEGKGHTLSVVFASLAVGQSVFIIFMSHFTNPELGRFDSTPHTALLVIAHNTQWIGHTEHTVIIIFPLLRIQSEQMVFFA